MSRPARFFFPPRPRPRSPLFPYTTLFRSPDRGHEADRLVDLTRQLLVAVVAAAGCEPTVPGVDLAQIREPAAREGAEQVQRRGAGGVHPQIGRASCRERA